MVGLRPERRRRDDRLRHGHRQGRRPLRLPLQPAEEPRDLLPGDRPRRPRRRAEHAASCSRARTTSRRSRTSPTATRRPARRSPACSRRCSGTTRAREFAVSEYDLSARHDVRPLVLKTLLTYLELDGMLRQGTPFYAGYRLRPIGELARRRLRPLRLRRARTSSPRSSRPARRAALWTTHRPGGGRRRARRGARADRHGARRTSSSRASSSCRPPTSRQRYTLLAHPASTGELLARLAERFDRREQAETARVGAGARARHARRLPDANELAAYFGETRAEPCGHCAHCLTGAAQRAAAGGAAAAVSTRSWTARARPPAAPPIPTRSARRDSARASSAASPARRRPARGSPATRSSASSPTAAS